MKKCIYQGLTIKFLIIFYIALGSLLSYRVLAQKTSEVSASSLPSLPFKQCWSYRTKMTSRNVASDNENNIIIPTLEGKLLALDINSGKKLWETELGGEVISDLANDKEQKNIYVATKSFLTTAEKNKKGLSNFTGKGNTLMTIRLRSLGKITGVTNWQTSLLITEPDTTEVSIFVFDHEIILTNQSGSIIALNDTNGEILWEKPLNLELGNVRFDLQDESLVAFSKNKIILADAENGRYILQKEINSVLTAAYFFNKTMLILGTEKGEILAIDIYTKKYVWKSRVGAEVSSISFTPKGILVTSFDNFIYLITPESGKGIWKRRLEGRLVIKPYLLDNYVVVLTLGSPKATILDLNEGKVSNQIFLSADNYFINRPVFNNRLVVFPTADGIFAFTNSDNKCNDGQK